jgi:hypothetical protein
LKSEVGVGREGTWGKNERRSEEGFGKEGGKAFRCKFGGR